MIYIINNEIKKIDEYKTTIPILVRSDKDGWVPTFDLWETTSDSDTFCIECPQNFRSKIGNNDIQGINPVIGHYNNQNLMIYWRALVNRDGLFKVNKIYSGKLRATTWQKRYCVYFGTGSAMPWLHSVITDNYTDDFVVHHINGVSADNRLQNLHILSKREHDSISHPDLSQRKIMFANPNEYWQKRKKLAVSKFITQLGLILIDEYKTEFIAAFAQENLELTKEILEAARFYINLESVNNRLSANRLLNTHLLTDYLDVYEIEKYLKQIITKSDAQMRMF